MNNTAERKTKSRAEREADLRAARRAEQATIVAGLKTVLEADEQLLGFARGRIAGGFRGKLSIGPEAFFAPIVNIGLTERRLVLQHIHPENGRPSEILPHFYALSEVASLAFSDIETYGAEPACRLVVHMTNDLFCRLRLRGQTNFESAQSIAEVFTSLTGPRRAGTTPTQRVCSQCMRMLDQPYKFCPYCGQQQPLEAHAGEPAGEPKVEAATQQPSASSVAPEPTSIVAESIVADEAEPTQSIGATLAETIPTVEAAAEETRQSMGTPFLPELPVADPHTPAETPFDFAAPTPDEQNDEQYQAETQPETEPPVQWLAAPQSEAEAMPEPHTAEQNTDEQNTDEQKFHTHDDTLSQGEF